ncbi:MAG: type I methionyl aminopeptidase [Anaerolineales bacterium]|nr:type I methionyl aminopeptidase [Anaerolineales bacterium]MCB8958940.1 type I methionyl aminopeptidase [Ardenticatenales bacterium]
MTRKGLFRRKKRRQVELRSAREIAILREAGRLVAQTFAHIEPLIKPGVHLFEIDAAATEFLLAKGAKPLYKGYQGNPPTQPPFPGVICASVNQEICHGLPDGRQLNEGDIVGIDIGLRYEGYCGDACVTFPVGEVAPATARLLKVAEECLHVGIQTAQVGRRLSDIGAAIEEHAQANGYSVARDWGGHGIGEELHEGLSVPHWGPAGQGPRLRPGMVFTIEPMINVGAPDWLLLKDGWTVVTFDHSLSAQFEHTIAITTDGPQLLSVL